MLATKYKEIERGIEKFWKNYNIFSEETNRYNQEENSCISTEYYFYTQVVGLSDGFGNVGTLSLAPYLINSQIMAIINEDKNSLIYPSSDEEWIIKMIMNYDI